MDNKQFFDRLQEALGISNTERTKAPTPELAPSELPVITPQDAHLAEELRQELLRRQLAMHAWVEQVTQSVITEQQFHLAMLRELEAYAKLLEDRVNDNKGRSPEQQLYIEGLAAQFRALFTQSVFERIQAMQLELKRAASKPIPPPQPPPMPVVDVTPEKPAVPPQFMQALWLVLWGGGVFISFVAAHDGWLLLNRRYCASVQGLRDCFIFSFNAVDIKDGIGVIFAVFFLVWSVYCFRAIQYHAPARPPLSSPLGRVILLLGMVVLLLILARVIGIL